MQPRDALIRDLQKYGISFEPFGENISIRCPFNTKCSGINENIATFLINSKTKVGSCTSCRKVAPFSEVLGQSGIASVPEAFPKYEEEYNAPSFANKETGPSAILPNIYSWKEFGAHEFLWANQWRIKGLIPVSARCVIAAPSGEGKSWCAMAMAKNVAAGVPYLGNPEFATTQCKVLYIENETAKSDFQRRGRRLGFHEVEDNLFAPLDYSSNT